MRVALMVVLMCSLTSFAGPKKQKAAAGRVQPRPAAIVTPATPYIGLLATTSDSEEYQALLERANTLLKAEYATYAVDLVPDGEAEQASAAIAKARKIEGVRLRLVLTAAREQMRASLLVTKILGGGLRGSWFAHASGPDNVELLEAIVPSLVGDVATDLGWTKKPVTEPAMVSAPVVEAPAVAPKPEAAQTAAAAPRPSAE